MVRYCQSIFVSREHFFYVAIIIYTILAQKIRTACDTQAKILPCAFSSISYLPLRGAALVSSTDSSYMG